MLNISYISGPKTCLRKLKTKSNTPINQLLILIISGQITPAENGEKQKGTTPLN